MSEKIQPDATPTRSPSRLPIQARPVERTLLGQEPEGSDSDGVCPSQFLFNFPEWEEYLPFNMG